MRNFVHILNKNNPPLILKQVTYMWLECNRAWGVENFPNFWSEKRGYKAQRILPENKVENDIRTLWVYSSFDY